MTELSRLPHYESHKVVQAAKVVEVKRWVDNDKWPANQFALVLELPDGQRIHVARDHEWMVRHSPGKGVERDFVGGYLVVYQDGYTSWSPGQAFEQGYRPVLTTGAPRSPETVLAAPLRAE